MQARAVATFSIVPLLLRVSLFYSCLHLGQEPVKVGAAVELPVGNHGPDTLRVSDVVDGIDCIPTGVLLQ